MNDKAVHAVSSPVFTVLPVLVFTVVSVPGLASVPDLVGVTTAEVALACCPNHSHALRSPS